VAGQKPADCDMKPWACILLDTCGGPGTMGVDA
jgi:hypothetical protein